MSSFNRQTLSVFVASASMVFSMGTAMAAIAPTALPTNGTVTAGNATISQQGPNLIVNQTTQRTILNWQSFDIGSQAKVTFNQPNSSSVALNRVLSAAPTTINGQLTSNGQVWLINPAGVVFGAGSSVNAGGLVASTMDIADSDFMAGKNVFSRNGSTASIINQGTLTANPGGYIALLAPELRNEGVISAQLGTVVLAAGEKVTLDMNTSGGLLTIQVDPAQIHTMIENKSIIVAQDGSVILSAKAADSLLGATINNSGSIEATSLTSTGGTIQLLGATDITNTGTLDASGINGGSITIAADQTAGQATISGNISVAGKQGKGGKAVITGNKILVGAGTSIDATGTIGGGEIDVGGSWKGLDSTIPESTATIIAPTALLNASATVKGNGGTIVVRSDVTNPNSVTRAYGTFLAKGGAQGGNGGRIETSGHWLDITGATGGAAAPLGIAGNWLLDPYDVTISGVGTGGTNGSFNAANPDIWTPSGTGSTVYASGIQSLLEGGTSVTITTGSSGSDNGNITVNSDINKTTGATDVTLTLSAANNIVLNAAINNSGGGGKLNVNLDADNDSNGAGIVYLNGDITTGGGYLNFGTGATALINGVNTLVGGDVYVTGASARTLSTGGGDLNVYGQMLLADTSGMTINTSGGNAIFSGLIDSGDSYTLVSAPSSNWTADLAAAATGTGGNIGDTYLATVTSRLESQVVATTSYSGGSYQAVWLGGQRVLGIGTNAVWRWIAGPEGLTNSGQGLPFFTQNSASGGTPINGAYNNWNGGGTIGSSEPNNAGGGSNLNVAAESALQTLGSTGLWNDLSKTTATLNYYMKETNLAASPLTINAGAGTVTFGGAVGSNKALASLTVNSSTTAINGGSVTTQGLQTYNENITLGSANTTLTQTNADTDFTLQNGNSVINSTAADASLTIVTTRDIIIGDTSSISSSTGKLNVTLNSDSDATNGGAILFKNNSSITSNGGNITIGGGTAGNGSGYAIGSTSGNLGATNETGICFGTACTGTNANVSLSSGGGNISLRGQGSATASTSHNQDGISFNGGTSINSGTGTIYISGVGEGSGGGSGHGIDLDANASGAYGTVIQSANTTSSAITLIGDASNSTKTDAKGLQAYWSGGITVAATAAGGGVSLTGTANNASNGNYGIKLNGASILAASGPITLNGGAAGIASQSGDSRVPMTIGWKNSSLVTSSSSNITLTGDVLALSSPDIVQSTGMLTVQPYTSGTAIGIAGGSGSLLLPAASFNGGIFSNSLSSIVVGNATAGAATVGGAVTFGTDTSLVTGSGGIAINGAITATGKKLTLNTTGSGTQTAGITAASLNLLGTNGAFALNGLNNTVNTIAANTGSVNYINQGSLTVDSINGTSGITTSSNATLQASGATADLTLNNAVTSTGGNIVLAAGRNFNNTLSSNTGIVASGGGKHYYVYSTNPANTTTGMTGYSKHYNQAYTAGSTPAYASSGNWFFYSLTPFLSVSAASPTISYSSADPSVTFTYSGFIDGDTAGTAGITGSANGAIAAYTASGAGYRPAGGYTITADIGTLASSLGYSFIAGSTGTLTVNPLDITLTSFSVANKVYDGSTAPTISAYGSLNGTLNGDDVQATGGTASFSSADVASGSTVTGTGFSLKGNDKGNYRLTTTSLTTAADITPPAPRYIAPVTTTSTNQEVEPTSTQPHPQPTAGATPTVTGSFADIRIPRADSPQQGVMITEIRPTVTSTPNLLTTVGDTNSFSFGLPPHSLEASFGIHAEGKINATMTDGSALPAWLTYDPIHHIFTASNVPPGALPLVVEVKAKGSTKSMEITISL